MRSLWVRLILVYFLIQMFECVIVLIGFGFLDKFQLAAFVEASFYQKTIYLQVLHYSCRMRENESKILSSKPISRATGLPRNRSW